MAVKEIDLHAGQKRRLAEAFLAIESGKCEPYIGAVLVHYRTYLVKGSGYMRRHFPPQKQLSTRYVACVYKVENGKLRTVKKSPTKWYSNRSAASEAARMCREFGGHMLETEWRWSFHNMPLSVMAAGLNEINIPGPSF